MEFDELIEEVASAAKKEKECIQKKLEYIKLNQILLSDYDAMSGGELFRVARIIPYKYFKCFEEENYFNYAKNNISLKKTKITIGPVSIGPVSIAPTSGNNNNNNNSNTKKTVTTTFGSINAGVPGMVNVSAGSVGCGMVKDGDQNSYVWEFLHKGDILVFLKKRFDKFGNVYPSWLISKKKSPGECFVRVIPILHGAYRLEKIIYR